MSQPRARLPRLRTRATSGQVTFTELFFDLVFVFVVTQATHEVEANPGWEGLGHALLPLLVVWWMFLAFGWLTNAVRPDTVPVRLLLMLAMMAFFVAGLDLPFAFEREGWAFPAAYLATVVIHTALYLNSSEPSARRGILRIMPFNAAGGVLALAAPYLPEALSWATWVLAVLVLYSTNLLGRARGFVLEPHHFVERHGLILLLVLGESIVAIGIGAAGHPVDGTLVGGVALGIAVASGIWWVYFNGDEERATTALAEADPGRRQRMAFNAFGLGHVVMVVGVILVAAGIADAIHHLGGHANPWWLGCGTALFLAGHLIHRAALGSGRILDRAVGAVVAVPAGLLGAVAGWASLTATIVVLGAVGALDHLAELRANRQRE